MFTDETDGFDFPPNPAVNNDEAIRRAVQVFYLMNEWANVYVAYGDGELFAEQVVENFNDKIAPLGMAYKFEMDIDRMFMVQLLAGYGDLMNKLTAAETETETETEKEKN